MPEKELHALSGGCGIPQSRQRLARIGEGEWSQSQTAIQAIPPHACHVWLGSPMRWTIGRDHEHMQIIHGRAATPVPSFDCRVDLKPGRFPVKGMATPNSWLRMCPIQTCAHSRCDHLPILGKDELGECHPDRQQQKCVPTTSLEGGRERKARPTVQQKQRAHLASEFELLVFTRREPKDMERT